MSSNQQLDGTVTQDDNVKNIIDDDGVAAEATDVDALKYELRYVATMMCLELSVNV